MEAISAYTPAPPKHQAVVCDLEDEDEVLEEDDVVQGDVRERYNDHVNPSINFGVTTKSILSGVTDFDPTKCLPLDIMHILNDGSMELLCRLILKDMCLSSSEIDAAGKHKRLKSKLSLNFVNDCIQNLADFGHLNVNRPSVIEKGHLKKN